MGNEQADDYGLKPLHAKIMEIMDHIHELCEKHNIKYFAIGGTAIGAVRHQGFIPWDDDLDIIMPFEDYHRFLQVCETELDIDHFYLQRELTDELPKPFSKIRMNNTTYLESVNPDNGMHEGIFIDVMCMHQSPDSRIGKLIQFFAAKVVAARGLDLVNYNTTSSLKKIFMKTVSFLPRQFVFKRIAGFVARWNGKSTQTVCHIYGRANFRQTFFPYSYVGKGKELPFENSKIRVFDKVESFLKVRFGNYLELPPESERIHAQHATKIDLERDYSHYNPEKSKFVKSARRSGRCQSQ